MSAWSRIRPFIPESLRNNELLREVWRSSRRLASAVSSQTKSQGTANGSNGSSQAYWTETNVTQHRRFASAEESLRYLEWRNAQYPGYLERMPLSGHDGKVVLDYGCGPGNDVVGFGAYSRPARLIGMDVSPTSLEESRARLMLHGIQAELLRIDENDARLPLPDASIDYISSSGVLHHVPDPVRVLRELRRVLKPSGEMRVMIYNYESIFLHLYVAYRVQIEQGRYAGEGVREAFRHCTDGEHCPISNVYRPEEWMALCREAGFEARYLGNAISMLEMDILPRRFLAIQDPRLAKEHRDYLLELKLDDAGYAIHRGHLAGVDACFSLQCG
jgi:ubiquinone/menaquinone biosynthesis C-methylase UbiE